MNNYIFSPQEKQRKIVEMYERQLSIPLQNMEYSYATFQVILKYYLFINNERLTKRNFKLLNVSKSQ